MRLSVNHALGRLTPKVETAVFSIIRESLNNVRRHARAKNIRVALDRDDEKLYVAIEDDGQGFDVDLVERMYGERGSIGLLNMKEWAETVGGVLAIESEIGQGTKVTMTVPLFLRDDLPASDLFDEH